MSIKRSSEQICGEINAVTEKAQHHGKKSRDFWDTRKALVIELKAEHPGIWVDELKARCKIGRRTAFKIAAIADGRTTLEKEREKTAASVKKSRESALRSASAQDTTPEQDISKEEFAKRRFLFGARSILEAGKDGFGFLQQVTLSDVKARTELLEAVEQVINQWKDIKSLILGGEK